MDINLRCSVTGLSASRIPDIYIIDMSCGETTIQMDIHRSVNIVKQGDNIEVLISKNIPVYVEGKDFVAHGYVLSKRDRDGGARIYISLWGFLVIVDTKDANIADFFNYMDKVYIKLSK